MWKTGRIEAVAANTSAPMLDLLDSVLSVSATKTKQLQHLKSVQLAD
jgi:hypothetical protein